MKKKKKIGLAWQILIGLLLGITVGAIFYGNPQVETYLQPIGTIFLNLIKMIVIPIVISSIIVGVAGVGDIKQLGKLGGKTLLYFEIITTIALLVGLAAANIFQPGVGVDMQSLEQTDISSYVDTSEEVEKAGMAETFINIVPENLFKALAEGDMLAVIFFSVFFGFGVAAIGERGKPLVAFFQAVADTMFYVTNQIMKFAPFGVFALIGVTISKFGLASLLPLGKLVALVYATMLFFILVVLGITAKIFNLNIFHIFRILKDEMILAYSTASSETVLPKVMEKMERFGAPKAITSFVIPTGYSFNLDGSTLYQAIAALFVAQMYGIDMPIDQQILLLVTLMITSKGIAGVPGVSFVVLVATFKPLGLPVEGLAFIVGVDRLMDMARTVVNVTGNSMAALVMAKWEKQYDEEKAKAYLAELDAQKQVA